MISAAPASSNPEMTAHNQYPMPFLMPADEFARRAVDAILARRSHVVIPWQMGWVARLLRLLPNWLYDRAFANAPRKARDPALASDASGHEAPGSGASDRGGLR